MYVAFNILCYVCVSVYIVMRLYFIGFRSFYILYRLFLFHSFIYCATASHHITYTVCSITAALIGSGSSYLRLSTLKFD